MLPTSGQLETRTRFKEDCDSVLMFESLLPRTFLSWKPGLASKRIATHTPGRARSRRLALLETRTRFKEDCDLQIVSVEYPPEAGNEVGNQDSLQRGLRPHKLRDIPFKLHIVGNQDSLQRGLRPCGNQSRDRLPSFSLLETRTRFKEDCDFA